MEMEKLHLVTPYKRSHELSRVCGKDVHLKFENVQPPGSFKIRGIGHMCQKQAKSGCKMFVCSSGGNAGMAAAYAAKKINVPITIIVPSTTPQFTVERIREEGAEVKVVGSVWDEANEFALKLCEVPGHVYISPFDHPDIWEGHSSIIDELPEKPDLLVCSVGGGGLLCGVVVGLQKRGWNDVPVLAVETQGTSSFHDSIKANKLITLPAITSIAKCLGAKTVTKSALEFANQHPIIPHLVSDKDTLDAIYKFIDDEKVLVEPACAASLAPIYNGDLIKLFSENKLLGKVSNISVIVCGGSQVNLKLLEQWKLEV